MSMMIHCGGTIVDRETLEATPTPGPTETHFPVAHGEFSRLIRSSLGDYGHEIASEQYALDKDGARCFGVIDLKPRHGILSDGDYRACLGLRNSHDKAFSAALSVGSHVFVCDNLAFSGDRVIARKHTSRIMEELPELIDEALAPLAGAIEKQAERIEAMKSTRVSRTMADHLIMESYRRGVINVQRIAAVGREWEQPTYQDFRPRTCWSLFNAFTHVMSGRVAAKPAATRTLHKIMDDVCAV